MAARELVLTDPHAGRSPRDERLDHLVEARCDWVGPSAPAVCSPELTLSYGELDAAANRLARHLLARGVRPGDRVGLLLDGPAAAAAALGVLKAGAAGVPLDAAAPPERTLALADGTGVRTVLATAAGGAAAVRLAAAGAAVVDLDRAAGALAAHDPRRPIGLDRAAAPVAFVVDTAGPGGRPAAVPVGHAALCAVVRGAAEVYDLRPGDRVHHGPGLPVDHPWVAWASGATVVAGPDLRASGVTALRATPEQLAAVDADLPDLRLLLVHRGPVPSAQLVRWSRPGRRILDLYGPPGAASAARAERAIGRPASAGVPLPGFGAVVVDPDDPARALPPGATGEIALAGVGLGCGYLDRADLPADAVVPDELGVPDNPSGRLFRTGDLGRVTADGELERHGRVGPRRPPAPPPAPTPAAAPGPAGPMAEVLAAVLGLDRVAPDADVFTDLGADSLLMARFCARLRKRADLPSPSIKDVYAHPTVAGLAAALAPPAAPDAGPLTAAFAAVLAEVLGLDRVDPDADVFTDLGADSLLMARFCARVRTRADLPSVSIKDVYAHPTAAGLAAAASGPAPAPHDPVPGPAGIPQEAPAPPRRATTTEYVVCGVLQLMAFVGYTLAVTVLATGGYRWVAAGGDAVAVYQRSVVAGAALFGVLCGLPILLKWLLVGRWRPREIRVWSLAYVRFWIVRTLVQRNPLVMFVGSPLYSFYLRALGARIGRGAIVLSRNVPVCTDLISIGAGTVVRKDAFLTGYRASGGVIETGPVVLGRDVLVGEATVLDVRTAIGDGAQLGHSSSLHPGQSVPAGERWHGSPGRPTDVDYRRLPVAGGGGVRRVVFTAVQLLNLLLVGLPLGGSGLVLLSRTPAVDAFVDGPSDGTSAVVSALRVVAAASTAFVAFVVVGLAVVTVVPRLLRPLVRPDRTYPLYGVHYWAHRVVARITNVRFFAYLFGDSSYIVGYLRATGYDLGTVEQTGSNFGQRVKHETPFLATVGTGTVVADGLSVVNAEFSSTSFRTSRVTIGGRNFLGNNITYPAGGRTGENCLIGTKALVPLTGPLRENTGLLGSPSFAIPRTVHRDVGLWLDNAASRARRLRAKNRHNLVTMALYLLVRWVAVVIVTLTLVGAAEVGLTAVAQLALLVTFLGYAVLVERTVTRLAALAPSGCSIYRRAFWRHERFWKVPLQAYLPLLNGTPLKSLVWRLLGVRMGRRVFDDGCAFVERTFVTVGDGCTLNAGSIVQCHSQEDGAFKSDRTALGADVTLGVGAFVHYGVTVGDAAAVGPDSFLMKGEVVPAGARWAGNPAVEVGTPVPARPVPPARVRVTEIDDRPAVLVGAGGGSTP